MIDDLIMTAIENNKSKQRTNTDYFYLCTVHQNYIASDQERNPLFLSVVTSEVGDQCVPHYRVILWRRTVSRQLIIH